MVCSCDGRCDGQRRFCETLNYREQKAPHTDGCIPPVANQERAQVGIPSSPDAQQVGLAPLEYCLGTSPSQAASWRPLSKLLASVMQTSNVLAVMALMTALNP